MPKNLTNPILSAVNSGQEQVLLQEIAFQKGYKNELLFFMKPECFFPADTWRTTMIVDLILSKFEQFQVTLSGGFMLSGQRLDDLGIMDRHYGYINRMSKNASKLVTEADLSRLQGLLGIDLAAYQVYGGHEFLKDFPQFDHDTLNNLWLSKKSAKLRSGFYAQSYEVAGRKVVLINGFHPAQLHHFTDPTHRIVVFLAYSNADWKPLKDNFAGDTYPERAVPESIRGDLYANREKYRAGDVSISNNYVHLSAGPFEALFEIWNFLNGLDFVQFDLAKTAVAGLLRAKGYPASAAEKITQNPRFELNGKETDLFSATENANTEEAIDFYGQRF